jgi:hypothetical protein
LRSKGRNTVAAYECSLTRAQKVAGFECHMERSMLAVDRWIEKHPEWFDQPRIDIEEGHEGWRQLIDNANASFNRPFFR